MIVTDITDFNFAEYLSTRLNHPPRSAGTHISTIYGDLDRILNAKRYTGNFTSEDLGTFGTIGFLWERILELTLADVTVTADPVRYFRPGEQQHDGCFLTPDYADLDFFGDGTCQLGLEEWKVSWKSVKAWGDLEGNFWRWLVQMKSYCYVLGTNHARLRALFIVGDWRENIAPVCRVREIEFTDQELQENWEMLINHGKRKGWVR